jgi:hypothetical protein
MGLFRDIVGGLSKVLNVVAPIAMFVPGLQVLTVAAMALNVVNALSQKPPNWKGALMNVAMQAIPMGLGKALQAFGGGTSMQFAKLLSDKLTGTLSEVAKKVANPQFTQLIGQLNSKIANPAFLERIASWVDAGTGTARGTHLTREQIQRAVPQIAGHMRAELGPMADLITQPLMQGNSSFQESQENKVVISPTSGDLHSGGGSTAWQAPPTQYRG